MMEQFRKLIASKPNITPTPIKIVSGANTYYFMSDGQVRRFMVDDWPTPVPVTGAQQARIRYLRQVLGVKKISDAFAHQIELAFEDHAGRVTLPVVRDGWLDHLADSTMETRFGPIYQAPAENNPANAAAVLSLMARPEATTSVRPGTITTPNYNPKMAKYFQGTTNTGVFLLRLDDTGGAPTFAEVECERWTGTAWANTLSDLMAVADSANTGGYDLEIFQSSLCMLFNNNGTESVRYTTNGSTSAAFTNQPSVNAAQGSRLKSFKALLWLFAQSGGAITVQEQTSPTGGAVWTTRGGASSLTGQLRDVDLFFQADGTTQRIFVLTNTGLYYWDETNYLFVFLRTLDAEGRAVLPVNINNKPALLVFKDAGRVSAYFADGSSWDVSPGGSQGMPSGKDFGVDPNGQVCVCQSGGYVFGLWSGKDTGGSVLKPLILALDLSSVVVNNEGRVEAGWHYIWQKADTSISAAASYIFIDPQSGDLIAGVQDATSEATTNIQLKKINTSPELQTTWDRQTSGYLTLPRLDFGTPSMTTTIWDVFHNSSGLGTNKSILNAYRVNGSTGAFTSVGSASTTDNAFVIYPDGTSTGAGLNFRDVQLKFTFATSAITDQVRTYSLDIGYLRVPAARWLYVFNLILMPYQDTNVTLSVKQQIANLKTISGTATLVTLTYSKEEGALTVFPIAKQQAVEYLGDSASLETSPRTGVWTLYLVSM